MRVAIYNRWLATLGGGEKHSLAIAEYLSRRHAVQVLSHTPVPKDVVASRLNLNLSGVEFVAIPDRPTIEMTRLTAEYDFFINASHMSFFPSTAPHSALLIYFPASLNIEHTRRLQHRVGMMLKRWLMVPSFVGVLDTRAFGGSQVRRIGSLLTVKLPPAQRGYSVGFDLASQDADVRQAVVALDGRVLATLDLPSNQSFVHYRFVVPDAAGRMFHTMTIQARSERTRDDRPVLLALSRFVVGHPRYYLYQLLFERWLKDWGVRLHRAGTRPSPILDCVDTYETIWANSEFTRRWIERYWERPSAVLYPPVDVEIFAPAQKRNQILSVGRFFAGSHNKKHPLMIAAFKEMVDHGLADWQLHLVGGAGPKEEDQEYLRQLHAQAAGYPIHIHADIPFADLTRLYGESAIYWHASGFGEDEEREPIKFEHFGITTVEAMASGCAPVVIGKGGQPEIVRHGENGFLWNTVDDLQRLTWQLIRDAALRQWLAGAAIDYSRRYDKVHFCAVLRDLLRQMGID